MKKLLIVLLLASPIPSLALDCAKHPIYCNIVKLRPSINRTFAMELANYIYKYSQQFGTSAAHSVAIAMQESSLINQDRLGAVLSKTGKVVHGVTDVGVFQLHIDTIDNMRQKGWDIDFDRLRSDVEYQTYWHVRLLKEKITVCTKNRISLAVPEGEEWSCYHSYTPKHRTNYAALVSRHLGRIQ